jgi:hypothetical protein
LSSSAAASLRPHPNEFTVTYSSTTYIYNTPMLNEYTTNLNKPQNRRTITAFTST